MQRAKSGVRWSNAMSVYSSPLLSPAFASNTYVCSKDDAVWQGCSFHKVPETVLDRVEHGVD